MKSHRLVSVLTLALVAIGGPVFAQETQGTTAGVHKPAGHRAPAGHKSKRPSPAKPAIDPDEAAATNDPSAHKTIPMDFTGMSRSVKDIKSESNAHSNSIFNDPGTTITPGIVPSATMKF